MVKHQERQILLLDLYLNHLPVRRPSRVDRCRERGLVTFLLLDHHLDILIRRIRMLGEGEGDDGEGFDLVRIEGGFRKEAQGCLFRKVLEACQGFYLFHIVINCSSLL